MDRNEQTGINSSNPNQRAAEATADFNKAREAYESPEEKARRSFPTPKVNWMEQDYTKSNYDFQKRNLTQVDKQNKSIERDNQPSSRLASPMQDFKKRKQ